MIVTLKIDESTINEIINTYGNGKFNTVETVVYDIVERYLNTEYFDTKLQIEQEPNFSLDSFILLELKDVIDQIIDNNGHDNSLYDINLFEKAIAKEDFLISEYEIGRINTLAEIYYKLTNKASVYGKIVEFIASYDIKYNG